MIVFSSSKLNGNGILNLIELFVIFFTVSQNLFDILLVSVNDQTIKLLLVMKWRLLRLFKHILIQLDYNSENLKFNVKLILN